MKFLPFVILFLVASAVMADEVSPFADSRKAFYRMEADAVLKARLPSSNATRITLEGMGPTQERALEATTQEVAFLVDTRLKPGRYLVTWNLWDDTGAQPLVGAQETVTLVPRPLPHTMPVILWGGMKHADVDLLEEIGFTHYLSPSQYSSSPGVAFLSPEQVMKQRRWLDQLTARGIATFASIAGPSYQRDLPKEWMRQRPDGTPYPDRTKTRTLNVLRPEVRELFGANGKFLAETLGDLPALQGALVNTEVRDYTKPSYSALDREVFRKATGLEIPEEVGERSWGVSYHDLSDFPPDRVIGDRHPILSYYRWFWKEGDGWNATHTASSRGVHQSGRRDWITFFDPAVRVPSIWGSGGEVDRLNDWTYTYPHPLKISLSAAQLSAMADGRPEQRFMQMTQAIWYRSQTAPKGKEASTTAEWEEEQPDATFITIAPDHLSEAFWLKLSYPVEAILYHGWGSLSDAKEGGYRGTHPGARERLAQLIREVIRPLGPTLRQVPDLPAQVAILESFTSQMLAGRGTGGYGRGWGADVWHIACYAGLQPVILYEEHLLRDRLEGIRVLIAPHCDVLTESVVKEIEAFQARGGILVGDEVLAPRLQPDLLLTSFKQPPLAHEHKAILLEKAAALQEELAEGYHPPVFAQHPELIVRRRGWPEAEYLFIANDRRKYGRYVGHHLMVEEEGVPLSSEVDLGPRRAVAYDLVARRPVAVEERKGRCFLPVSLEGGGGALFLLLERAAGGMKVETSGQLKRGESFPVRFLLADEAGDPLPGVIPLHLEIRNAQGEAAEGSGWYGVTEGVLRVTLEPASNDLPGEWSLIATHGLTGERHESRFSLP